MDDARLDCDHKPGDAVAKIFPNERVILRPQLSDQAAGDPVCGPRQIISPDIFLLNSKGYPVLPKRHKEFLMEMFKFKIQVTDRVSTHLHTV